MRALPIIAEPRNLKPVKPETPKTLNLETLKPPRESGFHNGFPLTLGYCPHTVTVYIGAAIKGLTYLVYIDILSSKYSTVIVVSGQYPASPASRPRYRHDSWVTSPSASPRHLKALGI